MSKYHCYLCASDDGIQLDIFGVGGKAICEKIESCLSVKIEEKNAIATKICHKCAFELDACSKFLAKYKQSRQNTKRKSNPIKGHCSLCSEPGEKGFIFDCKDGNPANETLHKIQEIFNDNTFNDKRKTLTICLDCRYNLDVLFDLKCIYQSTPDKLRHLSQKGLQLSELPKTKTRVVKRKTTFIPVPRLNGTEGYDTDSSSAASIMPYKRKRGRPRKGSEAVTPTFFRTCEQCEINVESGLDMYRYHRTGITVCKECWLAMDPEKLTHNKRKKLGIASGEVGTRRCAIILKDVLTNPAKYENIYKVEKDEHGNTTFIVTDDSSENEEKEQTPANEKKSRRIRGSVASVDETLVKRTRPPKRTASIKSTDLDDEPPVKIRDKGKYSEDDVAPVKIKGKLKKINDEVSTSTNSRTKNGLAISDTEVFESKTRRKFGRQSTDSEKNAKAASDAELTKPIARKSGRITRLGKLQAADLPSNETKTTVTMKGRKTAKNAVPVVVTTETNERPVRRTRAQSVSGQDATSLSNRHSNESKNVKSVSETESRPTKTRNIKTKSVSPKISVAEIEMENPYTCNVCHVEFRNKLIGMKHELTHAKQPEVKLQRVSIPEIIVEEAPAESSLIEESEGQSHDVSGISEYRDGDSENVDAAVPVSHKETSINVLAETNKNEENSDHGKSSSELVETTALVDEKLENENDKIEDKRFENKDKIEDAADENEDKIDGDKTNNISDGKIEESKNKDEEKPKETEDTNEDKTEEANEDKPEETEDTNQDKTEEKEDKNLDETEENEDTKDNKAEDKNIEQLEEMEDEHIEQMDETEDKHLEQTDETEDKNRQQTDETEDKNEEKTEETTDEIVDKIIETHDKNEDNTDDPGATEAENTVDNDENNEENTRQLEANDTLTIAEPDKKNNDDKEKTEITEIEAVDSEEPESKLSEEVDKEEESAEPSENISEQVLNETAETSENLNGVNVQGDANFEIDNTNAVEKDVVSLNSDAKSETVDDPSHEKMLETDNVSPASTSISPEKNNVVQDVVKDKVFLDGDDSTKDSEAKVKTGTTEGSILPDTNAPRNSETSESIVSDVLTEVFDLATAEVQKRLDNEPSRNEKCTTPVSETLENISREISNSADMPSLEPLVDNQSSNIRS